MAGPGKDLTQFLKIFLMYVANKGDFPLLPVPETYREVNLFSTREQLSSEQVSPWKDFPSPAVPLTSCFNDNSEMLDFLSSILLLHTMVTRKYLEVKSPQRNYPVFYK